MRPDTDCIGNLLPDFRKLSGVSDSPRLDCQLLLAASLNRTREWVIAHPGYVLSRQEHSAYLNLMARRIGGEPVAYLLGYQEFWEHRFRVTRSTLIPRPETELIVEVILSKFDGSCRHVLDLGTGAGPIAISLAAARPDWHVIGSDISEAALQVARENGTRWKNLSWLNGNWGAALKPGTMDLIVCNPPYIGAREPELEQLAFEPRSALVACRDGLAAIYTVIDQATRLLKPGGALMIEHGSQQQPVVVRSLEDRGFTTSALRDLQGHPRAVLARQVGEGGCR